MDGLEMQQHLVEQSLLFPLIVITGHGDVPLAVRAMKAGALGFIEKPFSSETILQSVQNTLARLTRGRLGPCWTPMRRSAWPRSRDANAR